MAFPIIPAIVVIFPLLAFKAFIRFKVRPYTDNLIAEKIDEVKENIRDTIISVSRKYYKNFYIMAAADAAMLFLVFLIFLLFKISMISLTVLSLGIIIITVKFIKDMIKNIRLTLPYFPYIQSFTGDAIRFRSLKTAVKTAVSNQFRKYYRENTTPFTRGAHAFGAKIGAVKSVHDIQGDIIHGLFSIANEKRVKRTVYPAVAIALFYGTFVFLIKLFVFSYTMKMNTLELILYPFRVTLPYLITGI